MTEIGVKGFDGDASAGQGAMLGVVRDAVHLAEDASVGGGGAEQKRKEARQSKFVHGTPRQEAMNLAFRKKRRQHV